ncbi:YdaS family helix-turn-helix protein [Paraburkholderia terrae]
MNTKLCAMDLKTYISKSERGTAKRIADHIDVSSSYLSQMAAGTSPISPQRCVAIELFTNGSVTRRDLRPRDWRFIWPEFAESDTEVSSPQEKTHEELHCEPERQMGTPSGMTSFDADRRLDRLLTSGAVAKAA